MSLFVKSASATLLLLLASCTLDDSYDGDVVFYNFSPATITALKVYDSSKKPVYTYAGGIKTNEYHAFLLPKNMSYFFEVVTAEDETYKSGSFGNFGNIHVIFSVDYDILEYGEGGRL
jgi:hypothetical protein